MNDAPCELKAARGKLFIDKDNLGVYTLIVSQAGKGNRYVDRQER